MNAQLVSIVGLFVFVVAALVVTQTKQRVAWAGWIVPAALVGPLVGLSVLAIAAEGPLGFLPGPGASRWEVAVWSNLLASVGAAFFLLQNRARRSGMTSEVWVLLVIFSGGIGLLLMLARTLYLERRADLPRSRAGRPPEGPGGIPDPDGRLP